MMSRNFILDDVKTKDEQELFWRLRDKYMTEDIIPNKTFAPATAEDWEYFFSDDYKKTIMEQYHRPYSAIKMLFLKVESTILGFAMYQIYEESSSKWSGDCFIYEFCILPQYRKQGLGTLFFHLLRERVAEKKKSFFALNLTNEDNERFWEKQGFAKFRNHEWGEPVYARV